MELETDGGTRLSIDSENKYHKEGSGLESSLQEIKRRGSWTRVKVEDVERIEKTWTKINKLATNREE